MVLSFKRGISYLLLLAGLLVWAEPGHSTQKDPLLEFPLDFNLEINLGSFDPDTTLAFRYHSFGNTTLKVFAKFDGSALKNRSAAKLTVTGSDPAGEDYSQEYLPTGQSNDGWLKYDITLARAGLYRLLPTSRHRILKVGCLSGCGRAEISLKEALAKLSPSDLEIFAEGLQEKLKLRLPVEEKSIAVVREIVKKILNKDDHLLARFPMLPPFSDLGEKRVLLTLGGERAHPPQAALQDSWSEQVASFEASPRPQPEEIDPRLPHIRFGHFVSQSVPPRMIAENQALALIMTALAERNGYSVEFPAGPRATQDVTNLKELIDLLFATGHHIEIRDERTAANFLSFTANEKYVRWPVWMKTDVFLSEKEELILPVPHGQYVWQITGPVVNARVNFYLGISGVGFFPKFDEERPQWTGLISKTKTHDSTPEGKELIYKAIDTAETYLRRIHLEYKRHAKNYLVDGYGFLGVCMDSVAIIERALFGTTSLYPLLRAPELLQTSKVSDGLNHLFEKLPYDSLPLGTIQGGPGNKNEILARILETVSPPYDPQFRWDEEFLNQVERARRLQGQLNTEAPKGKAR